MSEIVKSQPVGQSGCDHRGPEVTGVEVVVAERTAVGCGEDECVGIGRPRDEVRAELVAHRPGDGDAAPLVGLGRPVDQPVSGDLGYGLDDVDATPQQIQAADPEGADLAGPQAGQGDEPDE